jgi:preprotein translocase SecE subunit
MRLARPHVARTRQKSKQRKAKRLEQERKAAERTQRQEPGPSSTGAVAEIEEAQREAALEVEEAQRSAEVAASPEPEPAPVPVRQTPPSEKLSRRERRRSEVVQQTVEDRQKERAREKPKERARDKARERPRERARPAPRAERKREPGQRGRVITFFIQVWAELRRVQWPNRTQVTQATSVVLVFCVIAGLYLGLWDFIFNKLVKAIL